MLLQVLILSAALQSGSPSIDDLIAGLSSETIDAREKAAAGILERWKSWTDADLTKLRILCESRTPETASRAKSVVASIDLYRRIPEAVWHAFPESGSVLSRGAPQRVGELVRAIAEKLTKDELKGSSIIPVAIELIGDGRETGIPLGHPDPSGEEEYTIDALVRELLGKIVPGLAKVESRAQGRDWWNENKGKSEKQWNIPYLSAKDDGVRAKTIGRLVALNEPDLYPQVFEALTGIKDEYSFLIGLEGLGAIPKETLALGIKGFLQDRRLVVRLETAKMLYPVMKRESVDALIGAFEKSNVLERPLAETECLREALYWMLETQDKGALDLVLRLVRTGSLRVRLESIKALSGLPGASIEESIIQAFDDPEQDFGSWLTYGNVSIAHPRVCDIAGISMTIRMKDKVEYTWPDSVRARDRNLEDIRNRWRNARGLAAVPFYGPGVVPVPQEKVYALIPELASDSPDRRVAGLKSLSKLGPGAWMAMQSLIDKATEREKSLLTAASRDWSNCLRSVVPVNEAAEQYAKMLEEYLHQPFDVERLTREIGIKWFDDPEELSLSVKLVRGADGRGISISLGVVKALKPGMKPESLMMSNRGRGALMIWKKSAFENMLRNEFKELKAAMEAGPEGQVGVSLKLRKTGPKGAPLTGFDPDR